MNELNELNALEELDFDWVADSVRSEFPKLKDGSDIHLLITILVIVAGRLTSLCKILDSK